MLSLVTGQLVIVLVGSDIIQNVLEVPEYVLNLFEPPPVLGGTVLNLFEPPPALGCTSLDRVKPIVNRLAVHSVLSLMD